MRPALSQEYLKEVLAYNPEDGIFTWIKPLPNSNRAGHVASYRDKDGYVRIKINRKLYSAHRLAFMYMTGSFPVDQVDHINGVRNDNRWINLRPVTSQENHRNTQIYPNNSSGVMGVSWNRKAKKWHSYIKISGTKQFLGYFGDFFEAVCARKTAEKELNFHPNHGRVV